MLFFWYCFSFISKNPLHLRKLQTNLFASDSAACCVGVQLGQRQLSAVLSMIYFERIEGFLAVTQHADMMELHLPTQLHYSFSHHSDVLLLSQQCSSAACI